MLNQSQTRSSDLMALLHALPVLNASLPEFATADADAADVNLFDSASETTGPSMSEDRWPAQLEAAAFHGLAGAFVEAAEPHTESDQAALLVQFLVAIGIMLGRMVYFQVEASKHFLTLFTVLVGASAKARKGTSMALVKSFLTRVDELWVQDQVTSGLSSGEGLIFQVRDPVAKIVEGEEKVIDEGVVDKRVLVIEEEFASPLKIMARDGNTLSATLRSAWDTGHLRTLTKNSPLRATGAHIGIIGHITGHELHKSLSETDAFNGFANRFLWVCVRRSKLLPHGGGWREVDLTKLVSQLQAVIGFVREHGQAGGELRRDAQADALWEDIYFKLSKEQPGLLGAVTSRAEAQVMRLACLYAVLDCSSVIRTGHLRAGLAVWRYAEASAGYLFGNSVGDPLADRLLAALREHAPAGLSKTDLSNRLGRNVPAKKVDHALHLLEKSGIAHHRKCANKASGRPTELWFAGAAGPGHQMPSTQQIPFNHHRQGDERNEVNEPERLQTLRDYNILDTPSEAAFERITSLAARLLNMPVALVSFIDANRQWVKASYGIEAGPLARELSFCSHVILSEQVMVVEDATSEPRFRENAQVTGPPHIGFYAGAPLRAPNGQNLGSMCVLDSKPRSFTAEETAILKDLAALVFSTRILAAIVTREKGHEYVCHI